MTKSSRLELLAYGILKPSSIINSQDLYKTCQQDENRTDHNFHVAERKNLISIYGTWDYFAFRLKLYLQQNLLISSQVTIAPDYQSETRASKSQAEPLKRKQQSNGPSEFEGMSEVFTLSLSVYAVIILSIVSSMVENFVTAKHKRFC